jgi:hypothetical protein
MRIVLQLAMALTACLMLTGCPIVGTKEIIGDKAVKASPNAWNGSWVTDKSIISVKVADAEKGILTIYFIDNKKKKGPYKVFLRDVKGVIVANMEDKSKDCYLWTVVKVEKDFGYFMLLNMEKFKALIKHKKLPGEIIDNVPVLGKLTLKQRDEIVQKVSNDPSLRQVITYVRLEGLDRIASEAREAIEKSQTVKPSEDKFNQ